MNAMRAPRREDMLEMRRPGHRPHVKPMSDMDPEKPIKGGWDDKTGMSTSLAKVVVYPRGRDTGM